MPKPDRQRPPIYTVWEEFCGWTFDRTAAIPKSQRFTFGQRIDAMTLDILQLVIRAIHTSEKTAYLDEINLKLENCKRLSIRPQEYLLDVLQRLPSTDPQQAVDLTPANWAEARLSKCA